MKIALVSLQHSPLAPPGDAGAGGLNVHVGGLARALGILGHEVVVYTRRDDAAQPERVGLGPNASVLHLDVGPPRALSAAAKAFGRELEQALTAALATNPADVVHAFSLSSGVIAARALADTPGPALVLTAYSVAHESEDLAGEEDERALLLRARHVVATSSDELFELRRRGLRADRASVLPSGTDLSLFSPKGPVDARRPDWHRVVTVGRPLERKGVQDVLRALPRVPGAELIVAGGPPQKRVLDDPWIGELRELARELNVDKRVFFRGRLDRKAVAALLRSADVVVQAPHYESFGTVALEAMAAGIAVVATPVGGLVDTVLDGVTGLHIPIGDEESLAETLNHLLAKPYWRLALGAGGVQRAIARYSWDRIGEATLELYRRLVRGERRPSSEAS